MILSEMRKLVNFFILSISVRNWYYFMHNHWILPFLQKSNILPLHHLVSLVWAQILLSLLPAAGAHKAAAASHSPVMMTWQRGRTSRVLPGDGLSQRKTSDRPWKKSALHSVNGRIKDYVTTKLSHAAEPCEINLEWSREWPLTATRGKWKTHWKLENVLEITVSVVSGSWHLPAGGRRGAEQEGRALGCKVNSHLHSQKCIHTADCSRQLASGLQQWCEACWHKYVKLCLLHWKNWSVPVFEETQLTAY